MELFGLQIAHKSQNHSNSLINIPDLGLKVSRAGKMYLDVLQKTNQEYDQYLSYKNNNGFAPPVAIKDDSGWFFSLFANEAGQGSTLTWQGQADAYNFNPIVNAIINKKIAARMNARYSIVNADNKPVEPRLIDKAIWKLLTTPNPAFTWREYQKNAYGFQQIFGESKHNPVLPAGFEKLSSGRMIEYADAIWCIPPWFLYEVITNKIFLQTELSGIIKNYNLIGGFSDNETNIAPETVLRIRDTPIWATARMDRQIWGQSRLYSLQKPVGNIMQAYDARYNLMQNRGAVGIVSQESNGNLPPVALDPKEKENIENAYFAKHGINGNRSPVIVSKANLKWQAMTFSTKDLLLFEEIEDDARILTIAFGVPFGVTPFDNRASSLNGTQQQSSMIEFYSETIIPETENDMDCWTHYLKLDEKGFRIKADFSHMPIFQKSQLEAARAFAFLSDTYMNAFKNKLCTAEEVRAEMAKNDENNEWDSQIPTGTMFTGPDNPITPSTGIMPDNNTDNGTK